MSGRDLQTDSRFIVIANEKDCPPGAREAGEGLTSPAAQAIADAVYNAAGYRCMDLPISPEKVLRNSRKL